MVDRPADLPNYQRPPLVEVVLAVQFAELQGYKTLHGALLWNDKFRSAYPRFVEQPSLEPSFEVFSPQEPGARFEIKQMPMPPLPRLWFINDQDTELVQIQANRFIRNWRGEGENYPRYETLRESFFSDFQTIDEFFKSWNIGSMQPNQCEITYVNRLHLEGHDLRANPGVAIKIFDQQALRPCDQGARLPDAESCSLSARYVLKDASGEPRGRLHVTLQPWPKEPDLRLDLMVRGAPATADLKAVADFLDEGRVTIVHGFTAITTGQMHGEWGRVK
jgi:uncharacterized protein (TIGR04255 family)